MEWVMEDAGGKRQGDGDGSNVVVSGCWWLCVWVVRRMGEGCVVVGVVSDEDV